MQVTPANSRQGNPKLTDAVAQKLISLLDTKASFRFVEFEGTGFSLALQAALASTQERREQERRDAH